MPRDSEDTLLARASNGRTSLPPVRGDATANVMRLHRSFISTPIGDMLTLASDEGLCALEFTGPDKRMTRLEARLERHFPPHEIVDRESPVIARTRQWLAAY